MSRLMLNWGQFAGAHGKLLAAALALVAVGGVLAWRHLTRDGGLGRLLARLPGIGERVRIYELSRLYLTLGMLSEGGITILHAIDTVQTMVSASVRSSLLAARADIESGLPLSSAFEAHQLTTPISLRMLRVGNARATWDPC